MSTSHKIRAASREETRQGRDREYWERRRERISKHQEETLADDWETDEEGSVIYSPNGSEGRRRPSDIYE